MFRYRLVDQRVPAMCLNLAAARLRAELPSGKAPTTRVRRLISRMMRSTRRPCVTQRITNTSQFLRKTLTRMSQRFGAVAKSRFTSHATAKSASLLLLRLSAVTNALFGLMLEALLSILLVGGWLAIRDRTEIGIIVAFMSRYERMTSPVRDLLNFYRHLSMMRVHYRLVADAFA